MCKIHIGLALVTVFLIITMTISKRIVTNTRELKLANSPIPINVD